MKIKNVRNIFDELQTFRLCLNIRRLRSVLFLHSVHILEYAEDKKPSNVEDDDMSEGEENFLDGHPHGEPLIIDQVDEGEESLEIGGAEHSWKNVGMLKSASALVFKKDCANSFVGNV